VLSCQACIKYTIPVIEDAAKAIGGIYKDKYAGSMGKFINNM